MKFDPEYLRAIFGNPEPPEVIWEEQIDYQDSEKLGEVGRKQWQDVTEADLWLYIHDLAHADLQPDLFAHLFPVCLKFWYDTLMRNEGAARGDADFHYALLHGEILETMVTSAQREAIYDFMHDAFIERLEQERGFIYIGSGTPAYGWMYRFNSLGLVTPLIERIWTSWWNFDHPGKAVCAVMWATGLIYLPEQNPIFGAWKPNGGGGGPYLVESDASIYDSVWLPENLQFLKDTLTHDYLQDKMNEAAYLLRDEPEGQMAQIVAGEVEKQRENVSVRTQALLEGLNTVTLSKLDIW